MHKLKFLSLLKKLSKQELEGFHKYLKQYHRREKIGLRVFEYLIRFYPNFDQKEKLQAAYVYQKVFKADFDQDERAQKKMLNTASDLYNWLKNYLIVSKAQQNQPLQQTIWLSILQERGLKAEFSRKAAEFYQQTRRSPFKSPADAWPNWMASYFFREQLDSDKLLIHANIIQQCTETMTDCWEIIRLKMACEMSMVKKASNPIPAQQVLEATDFQQTGLSILKDTYEALWRLTDSGEEQHFIQLESLLKQYGQRIDPHELEGINRYAYNFAAQQSRQNHDVIHSERMHRLNKIGLEHGIFLREGYLPSSAFGNIVTVACHSKDFEWASEFINAYNHVIAEENRPVAILIAQAILAFETGRFQEAIDLLESAMIETHLDILRARSLLLRSYFELKADQDLILNTCTSFENLLRRSLKTEANQAMLAFVLILRRIVAQKSSKKVILDRIEKATSLYSRNWLLEKTVHYRARYAARNIAAVQHTRP
jgi:hypothetical protein